MAVEVADIYTATIERLLAPVQEYLRDDTVSEVLINGPDEVFIERRGRLERVQVAFDSPEALQAAARAIAQFVGKRLTKEDLSVEARLPDGSRVHIVQPPAARAGLCMAIRKFARQRLQLDGLVKSGSLSAAAAEFLQIAVALKKNVIVSGGTGSGKTTLLNCLSAAIAPHERIIVIEDSSELQLQQPHVVQFEVKAPDRSGRGGLSIRDLFRASLRMRPDRIVVGECRGGEALDMIQAMTSGHAGSLSTCHADSPHDALRRLETMALMSGVDIPLSALRDQLASAVDVVVQISRMSDGSRRVMSIGEVLGVGADRAGDYEVRPLFERNAMPGQDLSASGLEPTGAKPTFASEPWAYKLDGQIRQSGSLWQAH